MIKEVHLPPTDAKDTLLHAAKLSDSDFQNWRAVLVLGIDEETKPHLLTNTCTAYELASLKVWLDAWYAQRFKIEDL